MACAQATEQGPRRNCLLPQPMSLAPPQVHRSGPAAQATPIQLAVNRSRHHALLGCVPLLVRLRAACAASYRAGLWMSPALTRASQWDHTVDQLGGDYLDSADCNPSG